MINKKSIVLSCVVLTVFLSTVGCSGGKEVAITDNPGGGISASKIAGYSNIKELKKKADAIVHYKVLSSETIQYSEVYFTVSKAEVLKAIKGNYAKGDTINILQTGAIINGQDISISGDNIYRKDDESIGFLYKYDGPVAEDAYMTLGINDGRFDVKDSKIIAQGFGYSDKSKSDKKVKKSDPIDEMDFEDINQLSFTVDEFEAKIK